MMYWWWGEHMNGWGWPLMLAANLVFLALVVGGVIALVRTTRSRGQEPGPTPRDVLAGRFARGDIDEVEYRQRLDVLDETAKHP